MVVTLPQITELVSTTLLMLPFFFQKNRILTCKFGFIIMTSLPRPPVDPDFFKSIYTEFDFSLCDCIALSKVNHGLVTNNRSLVTLSFTNKKGHLWRSGTNLILVQGDAEGRINRQDQLFITLPPWVKKDIVWKWVNSEALHHTLQSVSWVVSVSIASLTLGDDRTSPTWSFSCQ